MKKILLMTCLLLIVFVGCTSENIVNEDFIYEDFSEEYYENFSDVKNMAYYLQLDKDEVTTLYEDESQLIFCIIGEPINVHDESILSYVNYAKMLESEGYQSTILDATISSTFELENDDYIIDITSISEIDLVKEVRTDIPNIDKMTNQNILYRLEKK